MKAGWGGDYSAVMEEYDRKRSEALRRAEEVRRDLYRKSPAFEEADRALAGVGVLLLRAGRPGPDKEARWAEARRQVERMRQKRIEALEAMGLPEDAADPHYECPLCGDTGYTDAGMCACLRRALAEASLESSGLGALTRTQRFDNFSLEYYRDSEETYRTMKRIYEDARAYADAFYGRGSGNLLFIGGTGLGKTHLCCAVAREVALRGYRVLYCSVQTMFSDFSRERFRSGYGSDEGDTDRYLEADLLLLDDLGTEVTNQFTVSVLYEVLNSRLVAGKSTVINTNLGAKELRERYADRITSRLFGEFAVYQFAGRDVRAQKLRER
ncbi:MAG: ATP-binding protein [Clostridia bacterium]|nr:ATP-binding protein [Clostridia bacterium]